MLPLHQRTESPQKNSSPRSAATLEESYRKSDYDELTTLDGTTCLTRKRDRGELLAFIEDG